MMSKKNLEYWQKKLSNKLPVLEVTTDKSRRANQDYDIGIETFIFPQEICQSVKTLNNSCGSSDFTTLLTVFKCLLYRYTYQSDVVVGSYIPNSNNSDFNTVALRSFISGEISFTQLLKQVNQLVNEDLEYQDFDWEQLVNKLNLQDTDIFKVMFSFQDAKTKNITLPIDINQFGLDLSFVLVFSDQGLKGTVAYNQELFEPQTIKLLIGHYKNLFLSVVENPDCVINQLNILSEAERHQILVEWNQTEFDYPKDKCIHQLFEQQVVETPDAIAVIFKDQELTYLELNNRANQLANYLLSLGIKPDDKVGICIERCLEMIIGILGILKAGAAYVPLDREQRDFVNFELNTAIANKKIQYYFIK